MAIFKTSPAHNTISPLKSAILTLSIIGTAVAIFFIEGFSIIFLAAYLLIFICILLCNNKIPTSLSAFFRSLVGALFIFSGFVKGVDPRGFDYKIIDYLEAYNMMWLEPLSLILSMLAIAAELIIGCMMFFNVKQKLVIPLSTLMMAGFTILTLIDATKNMVPDCGCFGEAVKMSNWQTFYKNLTIDLCLLTVWFSYGRLRQLFRPVAEFILIVIFTTLTFVLQIYCLTYLPIIDFRDWKEGKKMTIDNPLPIEYWVDYKHNTTGEITSMKVEDIPYNDSVWLSQWSFVDQRIIDNNIYPHNVMLFDENGGNVTADVISNPESHLIIVSYLLDEMKMKNFEELQDIISYCNEKDITVEFFTASDFDDIYQFADSTAIDAYFYNADDIELKAMIRSNPGVIAMKDGVVLKKWSHNNLPDRIKLEETFK